MTKYILSLDSGGIRSLIQVYFLLFLEKDLIELTGKTVLETFDFFAGTSGGAMAIAALVYSNAKTMQDVIDNYFNEEVMKQIFKRSLKSRFFAPLCIPKYAATMKHEILAKEVSNKQMYETDKKVLFTLYSVTSSAPKIVKSYSKKRSMDQTFVSEIVNASSAAPGYFPSAKYAYDNKIEYGLDGALFASDPADCIYADAIRLHPCEQIKILSIGTGQSEYTKIGSETKSWGIFQWATKGEIVNKMIDLNTSVVNYRMRQFSYALGHRYIKVQGTTDIQMDQIEKMGELKKIAQEWYTLNRDKVLKLFLENEIVYN